MNEDGIDTYSLVSATGTKQGTATQKLPVLNYKQALKSVNKKDWQKAICVKHEKMIKYNTYTVEYKDDLPKETKVVSRLRLDDEEGTQWYISGKVSNLIL